jgi:tetratricopeptide (TPR) repeat protein
MFCQKCGAENKEGAEFCKACGAALKENPEQDNIALSNLWYNRGVEFSDSEEYEKALMAYDQAISYNDKDSDIWNNKCDVLNILKRYDEAVKAGNEAVKLSPQDPDLWNTLCNAYIGINDREKADTCQKNVYILRKNKKNTNKSDDEYHTPREVWDSVNWLNQWYFVIMFPLLMFSELLHGNFVAVITLPIGALIGYYYTGLYTVDIAEAHNRNRNWAYFFGLNLSLLGWFIYWLYVELTHDPE